MRRAVFACWTLFIPTLLPSATYGAGAVQRHALVAGANNGGSDRPSLQYAVSDAERFAGVLVDLGGVSPANAIILKQPKPGEVETALELLRTRVREARREMARDGGGRTEVIVYYSGHADDKGLLLGEDRYSYLSLRERLDEVPADVRIAVLDACASGAFTRLKGGRVRPPFLVDESADMRGHAFLTSSAETEAAQESDRIGASYFTHYLISGLRGAADVTGEGKVTLHEAYQFAFAETLGRTVQTRGGAQHPSYDINLSGTGDVVMTDLRQTSATLVLGESLDGRFYVRNAKQELVVELRKTAGREIQLGLEPGDYSIDLQQEDALWTALVTLSENERLLLTMGAFRAANPEASQLRGEPSEDVQPEDQPSILVRAHSVDFGFGFPVDEGFSTKVDRRDDHDITHTTLRNLSFHLGYEYRPRPEIALTFTTYLHIVDADVVTEDDDHGDFERSQVNVVMPTFFGAKFFFIPPTLKTPFQPYLSAGLGPVWVIHSREEDFDRDRWDQTEVVTEFGGMVGAGLDVRVSRLVFLNFNAGYQISSDFPRPLGGKRNLSDTYITAGIGFQFGRTLLTRE